MTDHGNNTPAAPTLVEAALAVILDTSGANVVIALRKGETHLGGFWEFPGGKLEPGESAEQCAVREAKEEVGLDVEIVQRLPEIVFAYREKTVQLYSFICRSHMAPVVAHSAEEAAWVSISKLGDYRFPPANDAIIAALQANTAVM